MVRTWSSESKEASVINSIRVWLKASRLPSQCYIALPLLLGQALAFSWTGRFRWDAFALVHIWGVLDQLYIVYANDWADRDTDVLNKTAILFSGGSRVLVEGLLSPAQLGRAAGVMAVLAMSVSFAGALLIEGWFIVFLSVFGLGLLWAYSYPPFALSYRGGGELLQMVGVGAVLPFFGWYAQTGSVNAFPFWILAALLPMNLAMAVTTALPDEPSDRVSRKRTVPVLVGIVRGKWMVVLLTIVGTVAFSWGWHVQVGHSPDSIVVGAIPAVSVLCALCLLKGATPGSRRMTEFVASSLLLHHLWLIGLLIVLLW